MGLALHAMKALAPYLRNSSVLSLGYPDILATADECREIFGVAAVTTIEPNTLHTVKGALIETQALFNLLGTRFECVDVMQWRGIERIVDLNEPVDLGQFDLVIDPGTTEHCFNIGQAMMNAANAVKVGGRIYHSPPMTMINHGFYNICPTMLQDFYAQNDWEIEVLEARTGESFVPIAPDGAMARRVNVSMEAGLVCIARRRTAARLRYPVQSKYLRHKALLEAA